MYTLLSWEYQLQVCGSEFSSDETIQLGILCLLTCIIIIMKAPIILKTTYYN